jgi:beta-lactam-binding protein with PASTA domain
MTVPGARARLFRMNCEVGRITRTRSKVIRRGRVIAQSPAAGTRSKAGARVRLLVSLGR